MLAAIREIRVKKPVTAGMILELQYAAGEIGTTSVEIQIEGRDFLTNTLHFTGSAVFVSVDDDGKKKPHGLKKNAVG